MRKDLVTHFTFAIAFFLLATLIRGWFKFEFYPFWLGALLGTVLPDIDYLIYIYALKPGTAEAGQMTQNLQKRNFRDSWDKMVTARYQHNDLIFHNVLFQIVFVLSAFLLITSSNSLFGKGMVLAFMLHLLIDQTVDLMERGGINNWFAKAKMDLTAKEQKWYLVAQLLVLIAFGFFF